VTPWVVACPPCDAEPRRLITAPASALSERFARALLGKGSAVGPEAAAPRSRVIFSKADAPRCCNDKRIQISGLPEKSLRNRPRVGSYSHTRGLKDC